MTTTSRVLSITLTLSLTMLAIAPTTSADGGGSGPQLAGCLFGEYTPPSDQPVGVQAGTGSGLIGVHALGSGIMLFPGGSCADPQVVRCIIDHLPGTLSGPIRQAFLLLDRSPPPGSGGPGVEVCFD